MFLNHFENGIKGEIICMVYADEDVAAASDMDFKIKELKSKGFKR